MEGRTTDDQRPGKRLGRGLASLLAAPVQIAAIPEDRRHAAPGGSDASRSGAESGGGSVVAGMGAAEQAELERTDGTPPAALPDLREVHSRLQAGPEGPLSVPRGTSTARLEGSDAGMAEGPAAPGDAIRWLAPAALKPNPRQPRKDFSEASLQSLAESIRRAGIMQPIAVREVSTGEYEIIAGERRWRASKLVGLAKIPCIVRDLDDQTAAEWALVENVQREDLNPIERSEALRRLIEEFGLTHQELGERLSLDRASVSNLLRLGDLDPFCLDAVRRGRISQGHAKALLAIEDVRLRQTLAGASMAGDWSVRELERRVRHAVQQTQLSPESAVAAPSRPSAHLADLERRLGDFLGSRVQIQLGRKKGTGRLVVEFFTLDQFDGLLARLGYGNES